MPDREGKARCPPTPPPSTATSATASTSWSATTSGESATSWIALEENEDFATAERLGLEFNEDFRLLEDIGWAPCESCESFALTMPMHDLMELLQRLHGEAERVLVQSGTERRASEDDAKTTERFQLGYDACEEVLADLDPRER